MSPPDSTGRWRCRGGSGLTALARVA